MCSDPSSRFSLSSQVDESPSKILGLFFLLNLSLQACNIGLTKDLGVQREDIYCRKANIFKSTSRSTLSLTLIFHCLSTDSQFPLKFFSLFSEKSSQQPTLSDPLGVQELNSTVGVYTEQNPAFLAGDLWL